MYEVNPNIILMENTNKDLMKDLMNTTQLLIDSELRNEKLKAYLKDDLKALEHHTNELIDNIYARDQQQEFKTDIETIEQIFSYWSHHLKQL